MRDAIEFAGEMLEFAVELIPVLALLTILWGLIQFLSVLSTLSY